jgi:hypothetical protein
MEWELITTPMEINILDRGKTILNQEMDNIDLTMEITIVEILKII